MTFVLEREPRPRLCAAGGLCAVHRVGRAVRRHAGRRRSERSGGDPDHAPAAGRRRGRLRRGLAGARAATRRPTASARLGVRVFSWVMSAMGHTKLTDTSNGYRALRVSMLDDVAYRLVQPQYQTAELLIIAMKRGWRVTERPTALAAPGLGHDQEGQELALRLPLRPCGRRDLVEGAQGAAPPLSAGPPGPSVAARSWPAPRRRRPGARGPTPRWRPARPTGTPALPRSGPAPGWRGR